MDDFDVKIMTETEKVGFVAIMRRLVLNQIRRDQHLFERYEMRTRCRDD